MCVLPSHSTVELPVFTNEFKVKNHYKGSKDMMNSWDKHICLRVFVVVCVADGCKRVVPIINGIREQRQIIRGSLNPIPNAKDCLDWHWRFEVLGSPTCLQEQGPRTLIAKQLRVSIKDYSEPFHFLSALFLWCPFGPSLGIMGLFFCIADRGRQGSCARSKNRHKRRLLTRPLG